MARPAKPLPAQQPDNFDHEQMARDVKAIDEFSAIESKYGEDRDLVNQLIGQAQAFQAVAKFTTVVSLSKLQFIKENKLYRASKGMKTPDGRELSGTWAEFVESIGMSVNKVDEDLQNLYVFGEDALEGLQRIGAGYRELRKLRKLPDDIRQQVAGQLVNLDDKEEICALIDDLAAKHTREKDELTRKVSDLEADAEATDKVLGDKSARISQLEKELHKLRNKSGDWHPRVFEIANETNTALGYAMQHLDQLDTMRDVILNEDFDDQDRDAAIEMMAVVYYDAINQIVGRIAELSHACDTVFIGYKEKARPLLQVFAQDGAE